MTQIQIDNFLNPGLEQIRQSIRDIDDSYNNDWDILAELCQNSVDAIRKSVVEEGIIKLEIDAQRKSIKIYDNGIGIHPSKLAYLLKPFSTDKRDDPETIGEKGVGLTYVMFSGNKFIIKSGTDQGVGKGTIRNAYTWKQRDDEEILNLEFEDLTEDFKGTEVIIEAIQNTTIFELNFKQLEFILRTKTALGSTKSIWETDRNINIELVYKDVNGDINRTDLPFQYWLVYENLPPTAKINYDEFTNYAIESDRTDLEKRNKLRDKVIFKIGKYVHNNVKEIKYVACFVPKRNVWNKISVYNGLCTEEQLENENWIENFGYVKFMSGIFSSIKGMPTGIVTDHPLTGYAGYWANLFILFEDSSLKFDIGRKSLHGRQAKILKDYAKMIFNDYLRSIVKYISGEPEPTTEWDRDEAFEEIESMLDLDAKEIKFRKNPKDQEASVAALFFECIGNGKISDIIPLYAGYRGKYDLYAKWGRKKLVIEFKSRLKNIIKDFNDAQKLFDEIDCIICWDVSDEDRDMLRTRLGIEIEEIAPNILSQRTQTIPHSTHKLLLSGFTKPIYILDLKKILE
ncbi:Histidine kinase-, DNA gyrase B-, and HSP90-like ATPase [uncultured archaeon]|nr:Histidine kinase-, DNA gyrase B-, and HSP90-like ATPase [uncultured archaeon]